MLETFTDVLIDLRFKPKVSGEGLQHRWTKGLAQIDVLLPDGIGERAASRVGAGGAPTLPTPGGTQALHRSEAVAVVVEGRIGAVRRPNLVGALVMKAAAHTAIGDVAKGRHRLDFVTLAAMIAARDFRGEQLTKKDRTRLRNMTTACREDSAAMTVEGTANALDRLTKAAQLD